MNKLFFLLHVSNQGGINLALIIIMKIAGRHYDLIVSAINSSSPSLSPGCVLGQDMLLSQCLSPPRCINEYQET